MLKSVLTLGTFDGVHRGHQRIVQKVVERARSRHAQPLALSFGMPPRHSRKEPTKPVLLTTLSEKLQLLSRFGISHVKLLTFDRKTASTPAETFFTETISKKFHAQEMVVGPRVAFGKNRTGRLTLLKTLGRRANIKIHVVPPISVGKSTVSSRQIRAFLSRGWVEKANAQLGYPYSVEGKVIHGQKRGRRLGFPTANIDVDPLKILPPGVFWVKVFPADAPIPLDDDALSRGVDGVCNVGTRPTFTPNAHALHCEVFLLGRTKKWLYGRTLRVVFVRHVRAEKRFKTSEALQQQIAHDVSRVLGWVRDKQY